ncbi:putative RNA polymerase II nuclear localization SLC7A6OS [Brachionus plicatilis]|uniref:Probable RNA polymerase II nuclear localization protein SLC7A6OS n=1 Tax=Brachionus plicatilis TaxID=10195 RepID=A0A3M7SD30_BRAPC|nr:putative RNA polymerase II nuclear localization SLC7A6OS [Brachionus plicatilis]
MCTIIKVKRKITEDPLECLILECKKKKIYDTRTEKQKIFKQILKYGGSANSEAEIPDKIKQLSLQKETEKAKINLGKNTSDKKYNFTIQNKKRSLTDDQEQPSEDNKKAKVNTDENINIIDVVLNENFSPDKQKNENQHEKITCNGIDLIREKCEVPNNAYVYDIYYTKNSDVHLDLLYPNNYEIRSYNIYQDIDLIDDSVKKEEGPDNFFDEDEDSNDEDNWRNDYPDEEDDIDDEDDEEPHSNRGVLYNEDDDYDDYENGYNDFEGDDDPFDKKLAAYMKKSMNLDRSYNEDNDSFDDEYDNDEFEDQANKLGYSKSYAEYKKRILKELKKDYGNLAE